MKPKHRWINFQSPYTCMAIVVGVYCLKVVFKILVGRRVGSIAVQSDGFHNLSDILEGLVVIFAVYVGGRPRSKRFPLGLASVENLVSLEIGILVMLLGVSFLAKSGVGLLAYFGRVPGFLRGLVATSEPGIVSGGTFACGIVVVVASVALSLLTSRYQITLGRRLNSPSLVSDGKESLSDSLTEMAALVGVLGNRWGVSCLDPIAGLLVAFFILRTGVDLVVNAAKVLLNVSIPKQELDRIAEAILETRGVREVVGLYAYTMGKSVFAVAEIAVSEHVRFGAVHHMRGPIEERIKARVPGVSRVFLTFVPVEPRRRRCLLGIGKDRGVRSLIVQDFLQARNYVILDVAGDAIGRISIFPNSFQSQAELLEFVRQKRVDTICWAEEPPELKGKIPEGIGTEETPALTLGDLFAG